MAAATHTPDLPGHSQERENVWVKWSKSHISHSVTSVGDFRTNLRPSLGTGVGSLPEEVESQEHVLEVKMLLDWGGWRLLVLWESRVMWNEQVFGQYI